MVILPTAGGPKITTSCTYTACHVAPCAWQILLAYTVKENLRQLLELAGTHPDREIISHRLYKFYDQAAACRAPEVHRLAATIEAWWPAIEAGIVTRVLQCTIGGLQPASQAPRPQRLRIPQRHQPQTSHTLGLHPPTPAGNSQNHPVATQV
jgi:hypothetical protein